MESELALPVTEQRVHHVLEGRLVGQQLEVLEHAPDVAPQIGDLPAPQRGQVAPAHAHAAPVGLQFLDQQADEGRFARAGRPHEKDELALLDMEGDLLQPDRARRIDLGYVFELDHVLPATSF